MSYISFNTLIHSCSVASTVAALYGTTDLDGEGIRVTNWFVTNVELPILILTGFLSVACGILHWQASLRHLFR